MPTFTLLQTAILLVQLPNDHHCLVRGHGQVKTTLVLEVQYWTNRGWAIADVNYGGSSGYGREFRKRMYGEWGVVDVNDFNSCAVYTMFNKFESRYIQNLVGLHDMEKKLYERSPVNYLDILICPLIPFQSLEDKVVPSDQARLIYSANKEQGIPVALVEYEGEQHGFLKAKNIHSTLEQEVVFFARLRGGFQVADDTTAIKVDSFDD